MLVALVIPSFLRSYTLKNIFICLFFYLLFVQTLDFSLDDRLSLVDLTLALDNELLVSGNGIHQAALISYKNEIQHLQ